MKTIKRTTLCKKLGKFIRVENCDSRNDRGKAPNQFELTFENGTVFQSYDSLIGVRIGTDLFFTNMHDYSNTTSAHCTRWCNKNSKERRKGLTDGTYTQIILD